MEGWYDTVKSPGHVDASFFGGCFGPTCIRHVCQKTFKWSYRIALKAQKQPCLCVLQVMLASPEAAADWAYCLYRQR